MAKVFIEEDSLRLIGDIIRERTGTSEPLSVPQGMIDGIAGIAPVIEELTITENGEYQVPEGVDGFHPIYVNVASSGGGGGSTEFEDALITKIFSNEEYVNDRVTEIGEYAFYWVSGLKRVSFPNVTKISNYVFQGAGLEEIDFPSLESAGGSAFIANNFTEVNLPYLKEAPGYLFRNCYNLQRADFTELTYIYSNVFNGCSALDTLILRNEEQVCSLGGTSAFTGTLIASGTGYIYVPESLLEDYKEATNWSTYADQFRAIEDYPWIEEV